jgi:organic hydroperoxide reductase OsmC/OhrA
MREELIAAAKAADPCPVSDALRGNVEITVHDEVDDG